MRGLRLESATGASRIVLWMLERLTVLAADEMLAVSHSLLERCEDLRLVGSTPSRVLGEGSSHGVDLDHFDVRLFDSATKAKYRRLSASKTTTSSLDLLVAYGETKVCRSL